MSLIRACCCAGDGGSSTPPCENSCENCINNSYTINIGSVNVDASNISSIQGSASLPGVSRSISPIELQSIFTPCQWLYRPGERDIFHIVQNPSPNYDWEVGFGPVIPSVIDGSLELSLFCLSSIATTDTLYNGEIVGPVWEIRILYKGLLSLEGSTNPQIAYAATYYASATELLCPPGIYHLAEQAGGFSNVVTSTSFNSIQFPATITVT